MFQAKVGGKFAALCILHNDVNTLANSLKEVLVSTAEEVLGRQRKKIQPWITDEVLNLYDQRPQLKQQEYTSTGAGPEYRTVGKKMNAANEEWTEKQCKIIDRKAMSGNSKEAYITPKALTKTSQLKSAVIKSSSGNILTESTAVIN